MEKQKIIIKKKDFQSGFPECLGCSTRERGFLPRVPGMQHSGKRVSSPSVALGEENKKIIRR
jgi:hypothetical protein